MFRNRKSDSANDKQVPQTLEEWKSIVEKAIDKMPWFGLPPYHPTVSKNPRPDSRFKIYYERRVLISWLVGRPVTEIAKRAGCSTRHVYDVLDRAIYKIIYKSYERYWDKLGIFAVLDAPFHSTALPDIEFDLDTYGTDYLLEQVYEWRGEIQPAVGVCLICHRVVVLLANYEPEHNLELIPVDRYAGWLLPERLKAIFGHLACHFLLEGSWREVGLIGPETRFRDKLGSLKLGEFVINRLYEWLLQGSRPLTPVFKGKPMDPEDASRWWMGLLNGRDTRPKT